MAQWRIAIAASFTAEPIENALAFWMATLCVDAEIEFAPYHQIYQQLLDPGSLLGTNREGINMILLRFEDWQRTEAHDGEPAPSRRTPPPDSPAPSRRTPPPDSPAPPESATWQAD